jgi:hypothetical protein
MPGQLDWRPLSCGTTCKRTQTTSVEAETCAPAARQKRRWPDRQSSIEVNPSPRHSRDSILPLEQSRAVPEAAPALSQLLAVEGADHNDAVLLHGNQLVNAAVALADHAGQRP